MHQAERGKEDSDISPRLDEPQPCVGALNMSYHCGAIRGASHATGREERGPDLPRDATIELQGVTMVKK
jgi:hypothetical protein